MQYSRGPEEDIRSPDLEIQKRVTKWLGGIEPRSFERAASDLNC